MTHSEEIEEKVLREDKSKQKSSPEQTQKTKETHKESIKLDDKSKNNLLGKHTWFVIFLLKDKYSV